MTKRMLKIITQLLDNPIFFSSFSSNHKNDPSLLSLVSIQNKLSRGLYTSTNSFATDFRQMCCQFTRSSSHPTTKSVTSMLVKFEKFLLKAMKGINFHVDVDEDVNVNDTLPDLAPSPAQSKFSPVSSNSSYTTTEKNSPSPAANKKAFTNTSSFDDPTPTPTPASLPTPCETPTNSFSSSSTHDDYSQDHKFDVDMNPQSSSSDSVYSDSSDDSAVLKPPSSTTKIPNPKFTTNPLLQPTALCKTCSTPSNPNPSTSDNCYLNSHQVVHINEQYLVKESQTGTGNFATCLGFYPFAPTPSKSTHYISHKPCDESCVLIKFESSYTKWVALKDVSVMPNCGRRARVNEGELSVKQEVANKRVKFNNGESKISSGGSSNNGSSSSSVLARADAVAKQVNNFASRSKNSRRINRFLKKKIPMDLTTIEVGDVVFKTFPKLGENNYYPVEVSVQFFQFLLVSTPNPIPIPQVISTKNALIDGTLEVKDTDEKVHKNQKIFELNFHFIFDEDNQSFTQRELYSEGCAFTVTEIEQMSESEEEMDDTAAISEEEKIKQQKQRKADRKKQKELEDSFVHHKLEDIFSTLLHKQNRTKKLHKSRNFDFIVTQNFAKKIVKHLNTFFLSAANSKKVHDDVVPKEDHKLPSDADDYYDEKDYERLIMCQIQHIDASKMENFQSIFPTLLSELQAICCRCSMILNKIKTIKKFPNMVEKFKVAKGQVNQSFGTFFSEAGKSLLDSLKQLAGFHIIMEPSVKSSLGLLTEIALNVLTLCDQVSHSETNSLPTYTTLTHQCNAMRSSTRLQNARN